MLNQDLIVIEQLPIIQEKLKQLSEEIDTKVNEALKMECTEENKQLVKAKRTELKKDFNELEERRKTVKEQILNPYNKFDTVYKQCVTEKFTKADLDLKNKIDAIEIEQKKRLEDEAKRYFEEYKTSKNIDFITFEKMNLKIGVSDNPTKLKKQIKVYIDQKADDLNLIGTQEHKAEILVEYKQSLNVSQAITTVANRFKAIEEEKKKQEEFTKEASKAVIVEAKDNPYAPQNQETLQAPVEEKQEDILIVNFKVRGTRTKLKLLKEFLENGGYDYE